MGQAGGSRVLQRLPSIRFTFEFQGPHLEAQHCLE